MLMATSKPPTREDCKGGFSVRYRGFDLWWVELYDDWVISDGGGWLPGAFQTPDEAVDASIKYIEAVRNDDQ
jgi:hypothetical protein